MAISEPTAVFSIRDDKDQEIKQVIKIRIEVTFWDSSSFNANVR